MDINDFKDATYSLPDTANPNASRGKIHDMSKEQLRPFLDAAETWPLYAEKDSTLTHYFREMEDTDTTGFYRSYKRCRVCDEALYPLQDSHDRRYKYTTDEVMSLIVAHIRQCHTDIVENNSLNEVLYK